MKDTHMEPYWDLIKKIILESDVILEVLDARLIELSRNEEIEKLIEEIGRPVIFVVNKSDLVDKKEVKREVNKLKDDGKYVAFVSNKNPKSMKILLSLIKKVFKKHGKAVVFEENIIKERVPKADIVVGVVGYPNVGKSSIINALAHKKKVKVSKKAGTTHGVHWIRLNKEIKLIDTPGVIPLKKDDEIKYGLIGAKDSETLKNPEIVVYALIKYLIRKNRKKVLENFYGIDINNEEIENEDVKSVILKIAAKRSFLLKGGVLDENRARDLILRDWQTGKLKLN